MLDQILDPTLLRCLKSFKLETSIHSLQEMRYDLAGRNVFHTRAAQPHDIIIHDLVPLMSEHSTIQQPAQPAHLPRHVPLLALPRSSRQRPRLP
jgi:hypothetical protein